MTDLPSDSTPAGPSPRVVPLGRFEDLFVELQERFPGCGSVVFALRFSGEVDAWRMTRVWRELQHRHPKLRSEIRKDGRGRRHFVERSSERCRPIPLEVVLVSDLSRRWAAEVLEFARRPFNPAKGLLARLRLVRDERDSSTSYLLILIHHAIADGCSLMSLIGECLERYSRAADPGVQPLVLEPARTFRVDPAAAPKLPGGEQPSRPADLLRDSKVPGAILRHRIFTTQETAVLRARARQEICSLQGLLSAAGLLSIAALLPGPTSSLSFITPVNVRPFLDPALPDEVLGVNVTALPTQITVARDRDLWDLARETSHDIARFLENRGWEAGAGIQARRPRVPSLHLGLLEFPQIPGTSGIELEQVVQYTPLFESTASIMILAILVRGRLEITVSTAFLTPATSRRYFEQFIGWLETKVTSVDLPVAPAARLPESSMPHFAELRSVFEEIFGDDLPEITPETVADDVPGWDSLRHVTLVLALERRFKIRLPTSQVARVQRVGELAVLIDDLMARRTAAQI